MKDILIKDRVHYLGVNDRKKHLFENNWPLPYGVAYNSYLITDEKSALVDTLEYGSRPDYLETIRTLLNGKPLDYLIVNHMEPDHSSMIGEIIRNFPNVKVVANAITKKILNNYYPLTDEQFLEIKEGDILELGYHKLTFVMVPWVHWPETMVTYDTTDQILFSCDAFGSFGTLDGGIFDDEVEFDEVKESEMRRYYSNIVGKWSGMVQKAFGKLAGVPVSVICPSHGLIWRKDPAKVLGLYDKWSKQIADDGVVIVYSSMYGNTEYMADHIARELSERGIRKIQIFDASKTHPSFILNEIWKYKGLILGSCAYNGDMHPTMSTLTHEIAMSAPTGKTFGIFGSSTWNGAGVKALTAAAEKMKMTPVCDPVQILGVAEAHKMTHAAAFADAFVQAYRNE